MKTYSLWSNIGYSLRYNWEASKSIVMQVALGVAVQVALPYIGILLPKLVIDQITGGASPGRFCAVVGGMAAAIALLSAVKAITDYRTNFDIGFIGSTTTTARILQKKISMDYECLESPEFRQLRDKVDKIGLSNHTQGNNLPRNLALLLTNLFGFILYGASIVAIHPIILALLLISALISWAAAKIPRDYEERTRGERGKIDRKLHYLTDVMQDGASAKDIRLFSLLHWFKALSDQLFAEKEAAQTKVENRFMAVHLLNTLLGFLRDGAAYFFLTYLLIKGEMTLGNFVFTFAAIGGFASWVSGIVDNANNLVRSSSEIGDIRAGLDFPDLSNTGTGAALPPFDIAPSITLENVSYTYPEAAEPTLEHINIQIRPGERVAVVGVNGAGKTTLVKLITGLYKPTTGRLFLAGTESSQYNRDQYFSLFSAVFQDIHLLPNTIAANVSQQPAGKTDQARVDECLRMAGLDSKIASLPAGAETLLVRQVNAEAIELSGGEKQKLALVRALYKNAPVLILDEPTAALDPIAESETYTRYAELTKGKTAIYISHRLASTRFCDRILLLDGHRVAEEGTHDDLIRQGGKYAAMFAVQAEYYRNKGD